MKARRLNEFGVREFLSFIENIRSGANQNIPTYLLEDERSSNELNIDINIDSPIFESRFDIGVYLVDAFENKNIQLLIGDQGFWSWFALLWFDQLCPEKNGVRKVSKEYNYVLSKNYNHRPRHSIYMTWQLVNRYKDDVRFMLSKPPSTRGEITEQMMARQDILSSEGVMKLASMLYLDGDTGGFKKGAASRKSPGCVSRYISWLQQLQITFDIFSTNQNELRALLPKEFERFLPAA